MSTPIERAAEAMADDWSPDRDPVLSAMFRDYAQSAFRSIEVDELARVLHDAVCTCDSTTHPQHWTKYGRAVVAHLTKGTNDE